MVVDSVMKKEASASKAGMDQAEKVEEDERAMISQEQVKN